MSIRTYTTSILCLAGAFAFTAAKADFTETFEDGSNVGGWTWGFGDNHRLSGGNPGAYFAGDGIDSFGPILSTTAIDSVFTGDFRARGITGMGFDLRIDHTDFNIAGGDGFSATLLLRSTHGTLDVSDDDYIYMPGGDLPDVGGGWAHYDFAIDSAATDLPTGWFGGGEEAGFFRPGVTYNDVITHVDQVEFWLLEPGWFAIFQNWSVGTDNVSITAAPVPEPATLAALGLGAVALLRRKRK